MNKRKIMIMGAGIYQVPLIKKAKEMGLETLVVSIAGKYPGIALADQFFPVDTRDKDAVLSIAEQEQIAGICTSGTDVAVKTIGYVNEKMGLKGISYSAAKLVTDKAAMKAAFKRDGVSTAGFEQVCSEVKAVQASNKIGYPVMIKAVDSSGSRGIKKAENEEELVEAYKEAMEVTKKDYVLVESYIDAEEIGVDGYIGEDQIELILPHKKFVHFADGVAIPAGHAFPYEADPVQIKEIEKQITLAARALGLKNCPFNADVFIRDNKVWIIEMGGRTGATCIPELLSIYQGYDWYEKILCAALGEPVCFEEKKRTPCMAKLLFSEDDGVIERVDYMEINALSAEAREIHLDYTVGDGVDRVRNGTDRIGHVIIAESDEEKLDRIIEQVKKLIHIKKATD